MNKKITINDIARLADVSPSAVSFVLNNKIGVSEETRIRVKKIIREYNYTPNLNSQKLILKKSFNIFIVIDNIYASFDNMFYNGAIMGILEQCRATNYNTVLSDITNDESCSGLKRAIAQKNIDGAIILQDMRPQTENELRAAELPYVLLDTHKHAVGQPKVYCDYSMAAYKAVKYLTNLGHERVAFIGVPDIVEFYSALRHGYTEALNEAGIPVCEDLVENSSQNGENVEAAVCRILSRSSRPDALFCATDLIAIHAMKSLFAHGISVPADISVCAVDNIMPSQLTIPSLTTVDIAKREMGIEAANMLLSFIENPDAPHEKEKLIPIGPVVERESVVSRK